MQKMMSGLLFKNLTSYYTTKNKSKACYVSKSAEDSFVKNLTSKCRKRLNAKSRRRKKIASITSCKKST